MDTPFVAFELVCRLAQWFCVTQYDFLLWFYNSLGLSANIVAEQEQSHHIAPHCTTDIQALARSDQPAASGEGTGSLIFSVNSIKEQEQPWHIAPDCTTDDIQALAQRDQPAASREGTIATSA